MSLRDMIRNGDVGKGAADPPLPAQLFVVPVELAPKKTSPVLRRTGRKCPVCRQPMGRSYIGHPKARERTWADAIMVVTMLWRGRPPIDRPVIVRARYYRSRLDADPTNLDSALADVLQAAGVVRNDRLITIWSDHPLRSELHPKVEFWFVEAGADPWKAPKLRD